MSEIKLKDGRRPPFFWLDHRISKFCPVIGVYGFAVYTILCKFCFGDSREAKTTCRQIAKLLNISPQSVSNALNLLIKQGLIEELFKSPSPAQGPSIYELKDLESVHMVDGIEGSVHQGDGSVHTVDGTVHVVDTNKNLIKEFIKEKPIASSLSETESKPELFKKEEIEKANSLPNWVPVGPWQEFVEMRKKIKAPLVTAGASRRIISKLATLTKCDPFLAGKILDQSSDMNWKGVFPLHQDGPRNVLQPVLGVATGRNMFKTQEREDCLSEKRRKEKEYKEREKK